ncbi:GNAT family N-acetyltransferase [Marinoscillum sp. MHG1-6]|uniref:GNAT family N-acetyltransferase n=1 Tax=Marinoscillum sp. MHG1-6 TaxID=2959627 RepID=UPI00215862B4|nr:GNAT family N-acetyltransferase [Marinoscillum sp. MHG1-6]
MSFEVVRYNPQLKEDWNKTVEKCKNTHFIFYRNFMDYHSDRFTDHSLIFKSKGEIKALLPANELSDTLVSHSGLTFGGLLYPEKTTARMILEITDALIAYLKATGIKKIIYKAIPYIFHTQPSQEDIYALHLKGAQVSRRDISSCIDLKHTNGFRRNKKRDLDTFQNQNLKICESSDYDSFVSIVAKGLLKHGVNPVHSAEELKLLTSRFPNNIKLYVCFDGDEMIAGALLFINPSIIHVQYLASTDEGKAVRAAEGLISYVVDMYKNQNEVRYFNFGISTENEGKKLNDGLIQFKEGFGAYGVVQDFYSLDI